MFRFAGEGHVKHDLQCSVLSDIVSSSEVLRPGRRASTSSQQYPSAEIVEEAADVLFDEHVLYRGLAEHSWSVEVESQSMIISGQSGSGSGLTNICASFI